MPYVELRQGPNPEMKWWHVKEVCYPPTQKVHSNFLLARGIASIAWRCCISDRHSISYFHLYRVARIKHCPLASKRQWYPNYYQQPEYLISLPSKDNPCPKLVNFNSRIEAGVSNGRWQQKKSNVSTVSLCKKMRNLRLNLAQPSASEPHCFVKNDEATSEAK